MTDSTSCLRPRMFHGWHILVLGAVLISSAKIENSFRIETRYPDVFPKSGILWQIKATNLMHCATHCSFDSLYVAIFYHRNVCSGYGQGLHDGIKTVSAPGMKYAEIAGPAGNLALEKPTQQTSNFLTKYKSKYSVDGWRYPYQNGPGLSCSHTDYGDFTPSWQVDLQAQAIILRIGLLSREECCGGRMSDMNIAVSDYATGPFTQCLYYDGTGFVNEYRIFRCASPVLGRHVKISRTKEFLNICEVEIYGYYI